MSQQNADQRESKRNAGEQKLRVREQRRIRGKERIKIRGLPGRVGGCVLRSDGQRGNQSQHEKQNGDEDAATEREFIHDNYG